jgi:hypothetical protein
MPDVDDRWHVTVNGHKVRSSRYGAGKRWVARWRDEAGAQRSRSFHRKTDADRWVANIAADLAKGVYVDPSDRTTVAEYARRWLEARPHRPSTARRMSSLIETHIVGTSLGGRRLASVLPSEVQSWATDRAKELGTLTVRNLVSTLRSIYAAAVLDRLVGSSPVVPGRPAAARARAGHPVDSRAGWQARRGHAETKPGDGHHAGRSRAAHR